MTSCDLLDGGFDLLDGAIDYALGTAEGVTLAALPHRTPCQDWDLRALLWHVNDSMAALHTGLVTGQVGDEPIAAPYLADATGIQAAFREQADLLSSAGQRARKLVLIAGLPLTATVVATTGALELAVHGWDIAQACGRDLPIPASLAVSLMAISPLLVTDDSRHPQFAPAIPVPRSASPSEQLTAFLGRRAW